MCNPTDKRLDPSKFKVVQTPQDCSLIPTLAVTMWLGWMGILTYMTIILIFWASTTVRTVCVGLCILSLMLPRHFPGSHGLAIGGAIMKQAEKYFGLKTTIEDWSGLEDCVAQDKAVIFAMEPHDVLPYAVFAFNPHLGRLPAGFGDKVSALMTGAVFYLPFIKQVYTWVGGAPVDKKTFVKRLQRKESFVFCPGGVQEVTLLDPEKPNDVLMFVKERKGFIKLALAHGSPVVPVVCYGLDGSYNFWFPRGNLINKLSRSIGFVPLLFCGRFGIPFGIPHPRPLHMVIGAPIDIPKLDEVTNESVEKYHQIFLKELVDLYDRHKHDSGCSNRTIVVC